MGEAAGESGLSTVVAKWNKLNPFLQNQRIKNIYSTAKQYGKTDIAKFLQDPGNSEEPLRSIAWANSSTQQIYYNILRRSMDIPQYKYFVIPEQLPNDSDYSKADFTKENKLVEDWLELFNVPNTFKTIAMEVKREGKSSYLLRNKFNGENGNRTPAFATLQKMPTQWVKITGKSQLGFTISFNMLYFLNIANSPADFGEFMIDAWNDMIKNELIIKDENGNLKFNPSKGKDYKFTFGNQTYGSIMESTGSKKVSYLFWLRMPYDICYTFGSDNSQPWVAPDTMGLMLKLQELTDYGQLAGLIASTPLTAVLTGEIETIDNPRAGKNESVYDPGVLQGYMDQFNAATSTNVEAWLWPAKNMKLQQLSSDVNSSEIISTATENFVESAGEGGLTITTSKPNVSQVKTAQLLAASQQNYVTLQFEQVMNFILQHKLDFKHKWKIRIWGDCFSLEGEKKYLKELAVAGNLAIFPKLMSADGISMTDTKAITSYIKSLGFYKDFKTFTQEAQEQAKLKEQKAVGRPSLDDNEVENDATAKSKDDGTNTSDNRDTLSRHCPLCGEDIEEDQKICDDCLQELIEQEENK